jgi:hypothetical protein
MPSIGALSLRIPVRSPTLFGLNFPLTTLVGIAGKREQLLTCTQETSRAKLERLRSARLIPGDQKITPRHAKALIKTTNSSLLASRLLLLSMFISQVKLIYRRMFATYSKQAQASNKI